MFSLQLQVLGNWHKYGKLSKAAHNPTLFLRQNPFFTGKLCDMSPKMIEMSKIITKSAHAGTE